MTYTQFYPGEFSDLRRLAEESIRAGEAMSKEPLTSAEMERLVHELRVHQIELEMQNEELRRTQSELDASRTRYFDLYEHAPVGYFTLSNNGVVLEAECHGGQFAGRGQTRCAQSAAVTLHPS